MTKALTIVAAAISWIAVIVFGLISAYALFVGITFGGSLWNPDNLKPTWLWLGVVAAPLPIVFALKRWRYAPPVLLLSVVVAFALFAPYLVATLNR